MINDITCTANTVIELSRAELLNWVNVTIKTNLPKLELLGQGWPYCQLLDLMYPGKVPISKVNFKAKSEYEYINNFKVLQQSFNKLGVLKNIDIEKLVKCKYQDNLEFLQWFKKIFDATCTGRDLSVAVEQQQSLIGSVRENSASHSNSNNGVSGAATRRRGDENGRSNSITGRSLPPHPPQQHSVAQQNTGALNNISVVVSHNTSQFNQSARKKQTLQIHNSQDNLSLDDVLGELAQGSGSTSGNCVSLKMEVDFYTEMLRNIEKILDGWDTDRSSCALAESISEMLLKPPPEITVENILQSNKENNPNDAVKAL